MSKQLMILLFTIIICSCRILQGTNTTALNTTNDTANTTGAVNVTNTTTNENQTVANNYGTDAKEYTDESDAAYVDELSYVKYSSSLNSERRKEYMSWVNSKDNFIPKDALNFEKNYAPENDQYYQNMYRISWPFYLVSLLCVLMIVLYFFTKHCCGWHSGPKFLGDYYACCTYSLIGIFYLNSFEFYYRYCIL
jgi:hypothetical protein